MTGKQITTGNNGNAGRDVHAGGGNLRDQERRHRLLRGFQTAILLLSVGLIGFISYDTFRDVPLLENRAYMTYQLIVCLVFMADFFVELKLTPSSGRRRYLRHRWFFLLISIPWLNVLALLQVPITPAVLYLLKLLPLARCALAIAIVIGYITRSRIAGLFLTYVTIMVLAVYFSSLTFYICESPVNPWVENFGEAFYWCCMQTTTIGCEQSPVTLAGKLLAVLLSLLGIVMFPLFTVYLSSLIQKRRKIMLNKLNFSGDGVKIDKSSADLLSHVAEKVVEAPGNH